jgi:hypothetical protein
VRIFTDNSVVTSMESISTLSAFAGTWVDQNASKLHEPYSGFGTKSSGIAASAQTVDKNDT